MTVTGRDSTEFYHLFTSTAGMNTQDLNEQCVYLMVPYKAIFPCV